MEAHDGSRGELAAAEELRGQLQTLVAEQSGVEQELVAFGRRMQEEVAALQDDVRSSIESHACVRQHTCAHLYLYVAVGGGGGGDRGGGGRE